MLPHGQSDILCKEPDLKDLNLSNYIMIKYPEELNLQRQKSDLVWDEKEAAVGQERPSGGGKCLKVRSDEFTNFDNYVIVFFFF